MGDRLVALYLDGTMVAEGHSISPHAVLKALGIPVAYGTVAAEEAEKGAPALEVDVKWDRLPDVF
jgi:hypothetical protein